MEDLVRRAFLAGGTIEVDRSIESIDDLRAELSRHRVDAIITSVAPGDMSPIPLAALQLQPRLRVVLITIDAGAGELIELRPQRTQLGEVTPSEIVRVVEDDGAHARTWADLVEAPIVGRGQ
ncbi:MAG TPA: hypothetical protein VGQ56_01175 [Gemmatimonadaceae bacterium]|jgi:hypothetical protein|nr:hypothetical protein [Gemmatimonadaceae bacterium]